MNFTGNPIFDNELLKEMCSTIQNTAKTLIKMRENMNHRRRIERLLEDVRQEQQAMDNCCHEWGEAKYDPEEYMKPYGGKYVGPGSDPVWEYDGYTKAEKDRWIRECTKCGKIEYTYTQEPVVVGHKPSFK